MTADRLRLGFVSPVFLFPNTTGGRIRTTNILRGLKGGAFEVTLIGPAAPGDAARWQGEIESVCDRFRAWPQAAPRPRWRRAVDLLGPLPVNVRADLTAQGLRAVSEALSGDAYDVVVFDFVHAAVLMPPGGRAATVCFTHNVEAEIFARHAQTATNGILRAVWASQHAKMDRFEREALRRFDTVVAVSERDAAHFRKHYDIAEPAVIPTGVDLDYFAWSDGAADGEPGAPAVVFIGSMDWAANIDGVGYFLDEIWPAVVQRQPQARLRVVGRNPPEALVRRGRALPGVEFTGFVDDVRPYVRQSMVSVIPLRVGGGTRIKAFEAMAMGCPVVSTAVGIEGLDVHPGEHFVQADTAAAFANSVADLLGDAVRRHALSKAARRCVEDKFGHRVAAGVFERACLGALERARVRTNRA